jgi:hypothetical protein
MATSWWLLGRSWKVKIGCNAAGALQANVCWFINPMNTKKIHRES